MAEKITREKRGSTYLVRVRVPKVQASRATYFAGVEARAWAREIGKSHAVRLHYGSSLECGGAVYCAAVAYEFR